MIFKLTEKNNVLDILKMLSKYKKTKFSEIFENFDVSKSYMSRLLIEMEEKGLLFRTEVQSGKKIPIPSYQLGELGTRMLRIYAEENAYEKKIEIIDSIISEICEKIKITALLEVQPSRLNDITDNEIIEEIENAISRVHNESADGEVLDDACRIELAPTLSYKFKDHILYLFFENQELYASGNSIYANIDGEVALIRNIYDKTYLLLNKENINEIFNEIDSLVEEEFLEKSSALYFEETEACKKLNEEKWLRKKELFEKHYKRAVVKTPEEIAEKIIHYIENLK